MPSEKNTPVCIDKSVHELLKKYVEKISGKITHVVTEAILEYINCVKTSDCKKCDEYKCFDVRSANFLKSVKAQRREELSIHKEDTKRKEEDYILKYGEKPKWYTLVDDPRTSVRIPQVIYNKAVRNAKKHDKPTKRFIEEAILFRVSKEQTCYRCKKYVGFRMKRLFSKEIDNLISLEED